MNKAIRKVGWSVFWLVTILEAFTMAMAGTTKFSKPFWHRSFLEWGYPGWFTYVVGVLEICGAVGVLFPRVAHYAASGLSIIMCGALYTVLVNDHRLGWGAPASHLLALAIILAVRSGVFNVRSESAEPN